MKKIRLIRLSIILLILIIWQILSSLKIINTFLFSSPIDIFKCIINLYNENRLFINIYATLKEVIISFIISSLIAFLFASIFIFNKTLYKIFDPFLTVLNAMPKPALGPLIILIFGANIKSIIIESVLIGVFVTTINLYNIFKSTNKKYILLIKSFKGNKLDIYKYAIINSNKLKIMDAFKINISMTFIGSIMGELLVSKEGLGYLINYGTSIFDVTLILTCIIILCILSYIIYEIMNLIEKKIN